LSIVLPTDFNIEVKGNVTLSEYTTFQLGGPCKELFNCTMPSQLEELIRYFSREHIDFLLIGGGSNLLVSDEGVDQYVVRYLSEEPIIQRDGTDLIISGSTLLDSLVDYAAHEGLFGINYCSGIPGTVGGAIVGNAGAFGRQIGDVTQIVILLKRNGESLEVEPEILDFHYRSSSLKETNDIVLSVRLSLALGNKDDLLKEREQILEERRSKHPDLVREPCAGSFFRNIEPTSSAGQRQATGWFLDRAGGKELKFGGATIYPKHANIIIKGEGCLSQDVYQLHKLMAQLAKDKFDLDLIREVRFVGRFQNNSENSKEIIW